MAFNITYTITWYDNILSRFDFQGAGIKDKAVVAIFRKKKLLSLL